jgi:hypothetical protein
MGALQLDRARVACLDSRQVFHAEGAGEAFQQIRVFRTAVAVVVVQVQPQQARAVVPHGQSPSGGAVGVVEAVVRHRRVERAGAVHLNASRRVGGVVVGERAAVDQQVHRLAGAAGGGDQQGLVVAGVVELVGAVDDDVRGAAAVDVDVDVLIRRIVDGIARERQPRGAGDQRAAIVVDAQGAGIGDR